MKTIIVALILAHTAPSGWQYPWQCCSNHDCQVIDCNKLVTVKDGWKMGAVTFDTNTLRSSPDDQCHGCWVPNPATDAPVGRCLFMPKGTV